MLFVKTFMKPAFWGQHSGTIAMRRGWLKSELMSTFVCLEWLTVRELLPRKKLFSFEHCSNYLSPPPPFFGHQEPWVQIISNLEEKALFIDQEVDCGKRVKNFGQGPPPKKETFFQKKNRFSFGHCLNGVGVIFNTKIIKSTKIMITIINPIIVVIIVTWFCNTRSNVVFDVKKKLYNLPELGGGGER